MSTEKKYIRGYPNIRGSWPADTRIQNFTIRPGLVKRMNNFFCGMHFIVGLADQAYACLKMWEKEVHGERKVGSLTFPGAGDGGCGTERLVRTVCKSVQESL